MKRLIISGILLTFFSFQACNFNKSFKKDLVSGAVYKADGLGSNDVEMKVNGMLTSNNTFTFGDRIEFIFNNVTGLTRRKGKAFPGMTIYVIKNGADTLMHKDDLLDELEKGTSLNPLMLNAFFNVPNPTAENDTYKVILKIRDEKGPGKILYEMPFSIKKSPFLSIQSDEIEYTNIYFWNETTQKVVTDQKLNIKDQFILIIEGLDGFDLVDGNVFPAIELAIENKRGKYIMYEENMLENTREIGLEYTALKENQVPITVTFTSGFVDNPCQLKATITDLKNPKKKISIHADMVIE